MFSDRARVRRRGRATGKGEQRVVRFPGLPGARLSRHGSRRRRPAAACCASRRRRSSANGRRSRRRRKLLDALDAVDNRLVAIEDRRMAEDWEVGVPARAQPGAAGTRGEARGPEGPGRRRAVMVEGPGLPRRCAATRRGAPAARSTTSGGEGGKERDRMVADVQAAQPGGFSDRVVERDRDASSGGRPGRRAGAGVLRARRRWKPAYDLHYASARGQIRVETAAVRRADDRRGLDRHRPAAVDRDARTRDRSARAVDLDARREERVHAAAAAAPPAAGRAPLPVPAALIERRGQQRARRARWSARASRKRSAAPATATGRRAASVAASARDTRYAGAPRAPAQGDRSDEATMEREGRAGAFRARRRCRRGGRDGARAAAPRPRLPWTMEEAERRKPSSRSWQDIVAVPGRTKTGSASAATGSDGAPAGRRHGAVARAGAVSDPYLPAVSARGLDYVYRSPTRRRSPAPQAGAHPAGVADVPASTVHEATPALATDRVPARARAQRRQAAAAARAGDNLRRRRARRRRRDQDHRAGWRHRAAAGRRPGRQAGAPGRSEHQDHRRDHRRRTRRPTTSRSRSPTTRSRRSPSRSPTRCRAASAARWR